MKRNDTRSEVGGAARGSLAEAQYFLHLARRLGYLDDARASSVEALSKETFACLHGLIVAVRKEA